MKTFITIATFLLSFKLAFANDIDNLKTVDDVQKFLVENVNKKWKNYTFIEANTNDTSAFGKGKFFKIDLDNNGSTDLVINGKYFLAVTDIGNGKYESHFIDRGAFTLHKYTVTNIIYKDRIPLLIIKGYDKYKNTTDSDSKTDTLIFKFGDFIEFNSVSDNLKIEEIRFTTSGCYGTCSIFEILILYDRNASYNAVEYNEKKGKFNAIIDTASYNNLIQTINYFKLPTLKENYSVGWTDDQTVTLEIKFNNGQLKKIKDYGAIGTFGLKNLYNQLFNLRSTQKWK